MKRPKLAIILVVLFAYVGEFGTPFLLNESCTFTEASTESEKELNAHTILEKTHARKVSVSGVLKRQLRNAPLICREVRSFSVYRNVCVSGLHILFRALLI